MLVPKSVITSLVLDVLQWSLCCLSRFVQLADVCLTLHQQVCVTDSSWLFVTLFSLLVWGTLGHWAHLTACSLFPGPHTSLLLYILYNHQCICHRTWTYHLIHPKMYLNFKTSLLCLITSRVMKHCAYFQHSKSPIQYVILRSKDSRLITALIW